MKLPDAGFQMKKGWERLAQKKDEINHSLQVYRVPIYLKGEQLILMTGFEGETCKSPCNQNKKYPNKNMRMVGSWNSPLRLMGRLVHGTLLDFWSDSINTPYKNRLLIESYQKSVSALGSLMVQAFTSGGTWVLTPFILEETPTLFSCLHWGVLTRIQLDNKQVQYMTMVELNYLNSDENKWGLMYYLLILLKVIMNVAPAFKLKYWKK